MDVRHITVEQSLRFYGWWATKPRGVISFLIFLLWFAGARVTSTQHFRMLATFSVPSAVSLRIKLFTIRNALPNNGLAAGCRFKLARKRRPARPVALQFALSQ